MLQVGATGKRERESALWDIQECPFMALHKVGFIIDQYGRAAIA
jgi:hypothetical protein